MKRYFRIRIMLGSLLAYLILIAVAVGGILLFSYDRMERDTDTFLQNMLSLQEAAEPEGAEDPGEDPAENPEIPAYGDSRKTREERSSREEGEKSNFSFFGYHQGFRRNPSGFYSIKIAADGTVLESNRYDRTEDLEESVLAQVKAEVLSGATAGKTGTYKYGARQEEDGSIRVILLDLSIQLRQLNDTLLSAGQVAAGLFLLLVLIMLPVSGKIAGIFVKNAEEQQRFITDAGHDLKTPVAIARANLDVLEMTQGQTKWSSNIRSQVERLEVLVQKLLMLSRLEESRDSERMEETDLSDVISGVWQDYQLPLQQKGIRGETEIRGDMMLLADRDMLAQMLRLLMDNALQYTPEGGEIRLKAGFEKHRNQVVLENTAEQLPEKEPEQLTERFVRGNAARTQKSGGSGIGLAAVKNIVNIHRGRLRIEYPEGRRFRVTVELPGEKKKAVHRKFREQ